MEILFNMNVASIYPASSPQYIAQAATILKQEGVIVFPTETVYGLGGDATSDIAVAKIYAFKNRPTFNPLIIHVATLAAAEKLAMFSADAKKLAKLFWPGPLTLVLPRQPDCPVSLLACAGQSTIALRIPKHPAALELIRLFGKPIAAPSANKSGKISPTQAIDVVQDFEGQIPFILDGGPCLIGLESTIIDLTTSQPTILRQGGITQEQLEAVIPLSSLNSSLIKAPGMMKSHYAPTLPLRLDVTHINAGEGLLAFGPVPSKLKQAKLIYNLSEAGNLTEAAANFFKGLRLLDQPDQLQQIAVMSIPHCGLGRAINDRLQRAAAERN